MTQAALRLRDPASRASAWAPSPPISESRVYNACSAHGCRVCYVLWFQLGQSVSSSQACTVSRWAPGATRGLAGSTRVSCCQPALEAAPSLPSIFSSRSLTPAAALGRSCQLTLNCDSLTSRPPPVFVSNRQSGCRVSTFSRVTRDPGPHC